MKSALLPFYNIKRMSRMLLRGRLEVGEELAAHDGLHEHEEGGVVLEGGHQVDHEGAVAFRQDCLFPLHVLLHITIHQCNNINIYSVTY